MPFFYAPGITGKFILFQSGTPFALMKGNFDEISNFLFSKVR